MHVQGDGFAPGVTMEAILQSTPVSLGQVTTDESGRFDRWFKLPRKLGKGVHSLTLDGMAADGTRQHAVQRFKIFGRVPARIVARLAAAKRGAVLRALTIKRLTPRTRIDIACAKGGKRVTKALVVGHVKRRGGCPFAHRVFHMGKRHKKSKSKARASKKRKGGGSSRSFARYFRSRLVPGTVIRVVITHRGQAGRTLDVRVRARRRAKLIRRCTEPGLQLPTGC